MTLNDPEPRFQCYAIIWRWISQKLYKIHTLQWNTNRELHVLLNSVISNDLKWLSETFNDTKHRAVSQRLLSFLSPHCHRLFFA